MPAFDIRKLIASGALIDVLPVYAPKPVLLPFCSYAAATCRAGSGCFRTG